MIETIQHLHSRKKSGVGLQPDTDNTEHHSPRAKSEPQVINQDTPTPYRRKDPCQVHRKAMIHKENQMSLGPRCNRLCPLGEWLLSNQQGNVGKEETVELSPLQPCHLLQTRHSDTNKNGISEPIDRSCLHKLKHSDQTLLQGHSDSHQELPKGEGVQGRRISRRGGSNSKAGGPRVLPPRLSLSSP